MRVAIPAQTAGIGSTTSTRLAARPKRAGCIGWLRSTGKGVRIAQAAFVVGVLYVAISAYWGLGGTWLLDTVGSSLGRLGRAGNTGVMIAVWAAVVLKAIAAVLPVVAVRQRTSSAWSRTVRALAWIEAGTFTIYGLPLTAIGLLVQGRVIHVSATADHRALAWHAYLWDPWFLIWGLLVLAALLAGRRRHSPLPAAS
jgi:MYXO-CTERM domain-containing protein